MNLLKNTNLSVLNIQPTNGLNYVSAGAVYFI